MATSRPYGYPGYDSLLDVVYRARDWWRTVYILERVLIFAAGLFGAVFALTLLEAHVHFGAGMRWTLLLLLRYHNEFLLKTIH